MGYEQTHAGESCTLCISNEGLILDANERLLNLVGYDRFGLIGCQFESVLTRASSLFFHLYFHAFTRLKGNIRELHLMLRASDGSEIPVLLKLEQTDRDGEPIFSCDIQVKAQGNPV
ncbi:PAS domain-containing protein [Paenibacillus methanolicus]|uniref:PAS domain S-box-containing protein n=1 Tax=Paenibacillus methanolicus TaxID=582686 RepID=A0A5S5BY19_9BACL|nr:PAS domain-containing protein [Paenibacillus methanolicus]TYP72051.1 PAS domain S-box-containing protein [Paenibacillus methanolicus]